MARGAAFLQGRPTNVPGSWLRGCDACSTGACQDFAARNSNAAVILTPKHRNAHVAAQSAALDARSQTLPAITTLLPSWNEVYQDPRIDGYGDSLRVHTLHQHSQHAKLAVLSTRGSQFPTSDDKMNDLGQGEDMPQARISQLQVPCLGSRRASL